jgi:hypothetical protein
MHVRLELSQALLELGTNIGNDIRHIYHPSAVYDFELSQPYGNEIDGAVLATQTNVLPAVGRSRVSAPARASKYFVARTDMTVMLVVPDEMFAEFVMSRYGRAPHCACAAQARE